MDESPIHADARRVIDWYQRQLAARTHDLAFASCALAEAREAQDALRGEVAQVRQALDELASAATALPDPSDEAFEQWVAEHWDEINDARLAYAMRHADAPPAEMEPA